MEFFYRERRRALNVLMDGKRPAGGEWNYDKQNREAFKAQPKIRKPYRARPDEITREVMRLVERRWPEAPGRMEGFDWIRHHRRFKTNRRMAMVLKNVERQNSKERRAIRDRADALRRKLGI